METKAAAQAANLEQQAEGYSRLLAVTGQLLDFLRSPSWEERTDILMDFLDQRQEIIDRLDPLAGEAESRGGSVGEPLLAELQRLKGEVGRQDEEARAIIQSRLEEVRIRLKEVRLQRKAASVYHYPAPAAEGVFFDRRR
ncbi:MAG: flagellar protein FliT [Syntrophomonadaceae bacterium]|nr:flagellar protein FliT [Syntrophomonadaceae bacterium]